MQKFFVRSGRRKHVVFSIVHVSSAMSINGSARMTQCINIDLVQNMQRETSGAPGASLQECFFGHEKTVVRALGRPGPRAGFIDQWRRKETVQYCKYES